MTIAFIASEYLIKQRLGVSSSKFNALRFTMWSFHPLLIRYHANPNWDNFFSFSDKLWVKKKTIKHIEDRSLPVMKLTEHLTVCAASVLQRVSSKARYCFQRSLNMFRFEKPVVTKLCSLMKGNSKTRHLSIL